MNQDDIKNTNLEEKNDKVVLEETKSSAADEVNSKIKENELESIQKQLDEKSKQCDEYMNMLQRTVAEFDNYKKRTAREKDSLYSEAVGDSILSFLPVLDNMERALDACGKEGDIQSLKEGVEMICKQLKDVLKNFGVEDIKSIGEKFDPNLHNAVMHIEDESYGESEIVEEFQKGYKLKDRVIRYSMVKVAN